MAVQTRRVVPALLVLLVLFASQAAYAAQAQDRSNGHCAGTESPPERSCPLPLWLTCCDDQAAVGTSLGSPGSASTLALPLHTELTFVRPVFGLPVARRAEIPPDTPLSRSVVLLI